MTDDDRCLRQHVLYLAVCQVAETPVDPPTHAELAGELLQRLDGIERIAGDDQANVRTIARHEWKRAKQQIDAVLVDLLLQLVDLLVVRDRGHTKFIVALQQSADGAVEAAFGQARHH